MSIEDALPVAEKFRLALRRMPGPVSLVTTCEVGGEDPSGMIASAVIPVSMEPPSMLVAINQSNTTHGVVHRSQRFCINMLGARHKDFVSVFSDPDQRDKRFATGDWEYDRGLPYLRDARFNIMCRVSDSLVFGTHELFVGEVDEVWGDPADDFSLGWMEGGFARIERMT